MSVSGLFKGKVPLETISELENEVSRKYTLVQFPPSFLLACLEGFVKKRCPKCLWTLVTFFPLKFDAAISLLMEWQRANIFCLSLRGNLGYKSQGARQDRTF